MTMTAPPDKILTPVAPPRVLDGVYREEEYERMVGLIKREGPWGTIISHHFEIVDGRAERLSIPFRYAWPSELDLMAQLAGMTLRDRWSGWRREPFTSDSDKHVSVWEKPAP